jgi:hypothetical protein
VLIAALLVELVAGCDVVPRAPVDLRAAQVVSVQVAAESAHQTVCPGEAVPLDVDMMAWLPGKSELTPVHVRREDLDDWVVDPRAFHMSSAQGKVDREGVFHADRDARTSAETGFLVDVRLPNGPLFGVRFRPMYDCVHSIGVAGAAGREGLPGDYGLAGYGIDGGVGQAGGEGGPGATGPNETVYVTLVRTPFYPRLLAALSEGEHEELVLVPADRSLLVLARGGDGGPGGEGGEGGHAFATIDTQHRSSRRQRGKPPLQFQAQQPGDGGEGGRGGAGGPGGRLVVHIDSRFPELAERLHIDVRGGSGGRGGWPGKPGDGTPVYGYADNAHRGRPGSHGATGAAGPDGKKELVMDHEVPVRFAGLGGIEVL